MSIYTKDELNTLVTQISNRKINDITTIMFKDQEGTPAKYGTDYGFVEKEVDPSVSMFIPAAGCRNGSNIVNVGSNCYLWSSSLGLDDPSGAYYLRFNSDYFGMSGYDRCYGFSVRPIC